MARGGQTNQRGAQKRSVRPLAYVPSSMDRHAGRPRGRVDERTASERTRSCMHALALRVQLVCAPPGTHRRGTARARTRTVTRARRRAPGRLEKMMGWNRACVGWLVWLVGCGSSSYIPIGRSIRPCLEWNPSYYVHLHCILSHELAP